MYQTLDAIDGKQARRTDVCTTSTSLLHRDSQCVCMSFKILKKLLSLTVGFGFLRLLYGTNSQFVAL